MVINDLTISLMVLIGIRFIAFLIFILLFFRNFKTRYIVLALGWLIYMIGPIPDLFSNAAETLVLHPLFGFTATVGTFFLMVAVILCFRDVSIKIVISVISILVAGLGAIAIINHEFIGMMTVFAQGVLLICVFVLVIVNSKYLKNSKSNVSFFWLCATLILGLFHAFGFGLIFNDTHISIRFVITCLINVSLLEYFIYLDWEQSFKKLEESDARYRFLFNTAPVALIEEDSTGVMNYLKNIDVKNESDMDEYLKENPEEAKYIPPSMNIKEVNNQTLTLFQADSRKEMLENIDNLFIQETFHTLGESISSMVNGNDYNSFETAVRTIKGEKRDVLVSCYYPESKNLNKKTIISMTDVTEKNEAQKAIEASLKEKEVLLQEVHHRVKNNLAIISSILGMQLLNTENADMKELISSITNRINTMAIVHDELYTNSSLDDIDIPDYIRQLTDGIQIGLFNGSKPIRMILDIAPVRFSINLLIPLGMLINEIVTNSIKHAFSNTEEPQIDVKLFSDDENSYILSIRDNGSGISKDDFYKRSDTTGFTIIDALVNQINAELSINKNNGTEFRLYLAKEMTLK